MMDECNVAQVLWLLKNYSNVIDNIGRVRQLFGKNAHFVLARIYSNCNCFLTSDLVYPAQLGLGPWVQNLRNAPKLNNQDK